MRMYILYCFREYKNYTLKESQPLQLIARGGEIKLLTAPAPIPESSSE